MSAARQERIRALVVDDEPLARSNLKVLLKGDPDVVLAGECGSGTEALKKIRELDPDLVFLDVQMPECDGFDVLELLGGDVQPAIVFVTAYDQYAIRAFEAGALDYVLKPFDNARFERTLARVKERIRSRIPEMVERIAVKTSGAVLFFAPQEIDWIEAADYYACLHLGAKSHMLRRSLVELEKDLRKARFCRIHRSAIVNLERVRGLTLNEEGEHEVLLDTGANLRVSRRYRKELEEKLGVGEKSQAGCPEIGRKI
jgi:two-component system, LytTR family, response regulator